MDYQAGAFGPINDLESQRTYWTWLRNTNYPYSATVLADIRQRLSEQQQMQAMMNQGVNVNDMGTDQASILAEDVRQ